MRADPGTAPEESDGRIAVVLAVLAFVLHVRVLALPVLEVSDAAVASATNARAALDAAGLGGLVLRLLEITSSPVPARFLALALHAGSTALAFLLARRLGLARGAGVLVALLFAVHPLRSEALAWLTRLGTLLGACAFLLGCVLALDPAGRGRRIGTAALALAFLADPRLLGGLAWLIFVERRVLARRKPAAEVAVVLAPAALAGSWALGGLDGFGPHVGLFQALIHAPLVLGAHVAKWLLPFGLSPYHAHPALDEGAAPWAIVAGWLVLGVALALLVRYGRRALAPRELGVLLFLLLGALHAFPREGSLWREADAYLPALGLELALLGGLAPAFARVPERAITAAAVAFAVLVTLALRMQARLGDWRGEEALQRAALAVRAEPRAHVALGRWHVLHGRLSPAQDEYERALELRPSDTEARFRLGELELRRGLIPGQEQHLVDALERLRVGHPRSGLRVGEVYQRLGEDEAARDVLLDVVRELPHEAVAHTRLGMAELALGHAADAGTAFERATELDAGSVEAWCGLGIAHFQAQDGEGAREALERALALEPDHAESNATLGRVLEGAGALPEAEVHYRRAVGVNPDSIDALFALGELLLRTERADEAVRYLERVTSLRTSPPHVRASNDLAAIYLERDELERARELVERVLAFNPANAEARALLARIEAAEKR